VRRTALSDVLALPVIQAGRPVVLTEGPSLDRPVRWVHVSELPDIAPLLKGGELILTTGIALPGTTSELKAFVRTLREAAACALMIELGRRFEQVPASMVQAGNAHDLPIIALRRPVRFVTVTETVHALILNEQYELLRFSEQAQREFTGLSIEGASLSEIIDRASAMAGQPVVLEDLSHRAFAYSCEPGATASLLEDWESRSRRAGPTEMTGVVQPEGWLVTPVGPKRQRWGRLVMPSPGPDAARLSLVLERAAEALAVSRLVDGDLADLVHQVHGGLLADLLRGRVTDERELLSRATALGLRCHRSAFVGLAVQVPPREQLDAAAAEDRDQALTKALAEAISRAGLSAVVSTLQRRQALALAAVGSDSSLDRVLRQVASSARSQLARLDWTDSYTLAVGPQVSSLAESPASLAEAARVGRVALTLRGTKSQPYYQSKDVHLRGLLAQLADDPRFQAYAEDQLRHLRRYDSEHRGALLATLQQYFQAGGNKTLLARMSHLSRPALYARLSMIEKLLEVSLDDPEAAVALHVALIIDQMQGLVEPPPTPHGAIVR
jgi:purine catabolism regulator